MSATGESLAIVATSAYPDPEPLGAFLRLAQRDRFGVHRLVDDPNVADIILFVENTQWRRDVYYRTLRAHPWVRAFREKCFMYNEVDGPWTVLPGLYCSMPQRFFNPGRHRPCAYIAAQNLNVFYLPPEEARPDLLFSFTGRRAAPVRDRILELDHPRALIRDTTLVHHQFGNRSAQAMTAYAEVLNRSKFVLCPRGRGTSSFRLFETLQAGRVPVIVADQWVPPFGPAWDQCSIRIAENEVSRIPALLEAAEASWEILAGNARNTWETWFAPDVLFHRMVEDCHAIQGSRRVPEAVAQRLPNWVFLGQRIRSRAGYIRSRLAQK